MVPSKTHKSIENISVFYMVRSIVNGKILIAYEHMVLIYL